MKILVIRLMGLGDVAAILVPAVKLTHQQYPNAIVDVMTYAAGVELMSLMPEVNAVLAITKAQWPSELNAAIVSFMQIADVVVAEQYDLVINLDTWWLPCFLARVLKDAGIPLQGNYINLAIEEFFKQIQLDNFTQSYFENPSEYLASTYPNMADWTTAWWDKYPEVNGYPAFYLNHCCGFKMPIDISLDIAADAVFKGQAQGKKIIALSCNGSKQSKQYPYGDALKNLLEQHGFYVWSQFDGSAAMHTTLARLKVTDLLITVATSTQWLAKLVACRSLMISGALAPRMLGAEFSVEKIQSCQHCYQKNCVENINFACMQVAPELILAQVLEIH